MPQNHNFAGFLKAFALQFLQKALLLQQIIVIHNALSAVMVPGVGCIF